MSIKPRQIWRDTGTGTVAYVTDFEGGFVDYLSFFGDSIEHISNVSRVSFENEFEFLFDIEEGKNIINKIREVLSGD